MIWLLYRPYSISIDWAKPGTPLAARLEAGGVYYHIVLESSLLRGSFFKMSISRAKKASLRRTCIYCYAWHLCCNGSSTQLLWSNIAASRGSSFQCFKRTDRARGARSVIWSRNLNYLMYLRSSYTNHSCVLWGSAYLLFIIFYFISARFTARLIPNGFFSFLVFVNDLINYYNIMIYQIVRRHNYLNKLYLNNCALQQDRGPFWHSRSKTLFLHSWKKT